MNNDWFVWIQKSSSSYDLLLTALAANSVATVVHQRTRCFQTTDDFTVEFNVSVYVCVLPPVTDYPSLPLLLVSLSAQCDLHLRCVSLLNIHGEVCKQKKKERKLKGRLRRKHTDARGRRRKTSKKVKTEQRVEKKNSSIFAASSETFHGKQHDWQSESEEERRGKKGRGVVRHVKCAKNKIKRKYKRVDTRRERGSLARAGEG